MCRFKNSGRWATNCVKNGESSTNNEKQANSGMLYPYTICRKNNAVPHTPFPTSPSVLVSPGAAIKARPDAGYTGGEDLEFEDFARLRRGQSVDQP